MRHWLNLKPWPLAFWDEVQSIPNMRGAALQPPVFCLLAMFPFLSTVPSPVNSSLPSSDSWSLSSFLLTSCSTNKFFLTWEKSLDSEVTQEHEIKSRVWKNGNLPCCRSVYHLILSTKGIISRYFDQILCEILPKLQQIQKRKVGEGRNLTCTSCSHPN